jgi:hypothetical protein
MVLIRAAVLALLQCTNVGVMLTVQYDRQDNAMDDYHKQDGLSGRRFAFDS